MAHLELVAGFRKFASAATFDFIKMQLLVKTLDSMVEDFHPADITSSLTDGDDCDEFLERYASVAEVDMTKDGLKMRQQLIALVEDYIEAGCPKLEAKVEEKKELPEETVALIAGFRKFASAATFDFIKMQLIVKTLDSMAEDFHPADITSCLTDADDCDEFLERYAHVGNVDMTKDGLKMRQQLIAIVEEFVEAGCPKMEAKKEVKQEIPEDVAEIMKKFRAYVAEATLNFVTVEGVNKCLDSMAEDFHPADIKSCLTDGNDCDELLERYAGVNAVDMTKDGLKMRQALIGVVEDFAEKEGLAPEMCF